ncbi:ribonuclease PH [candidate division TA06 bacterium SM23_40]|uniref:Ribonuclease PH n=1 Tax=candidate division TA06 bacterium SM23_40 TaxID=1703774 RepID=A0A0S8FYZ5_UNCT6|nr:MAG: ribonuclease PH [candidate division TA06 bacterium SM23_40]
MDWERVDGRAPDEIRPVTISRNYLKHAESSVLMEMGETKVICAATVIDQVPGWLRGAGQGWVTAEYGMLPRSTRERVPREHARGRASGRTHEIQRLIGRSLRAVTDLSALGERMITIDCDVIQADGGTRTASITGGFVALYDAFEGLRRGGVLDHIPLEDFVSAVSVGIIDSAIIVDLNYEEDSQSEVDMNVVMTGSMRLVEIQGTAEGRPFTVEELRTMVTQAERSIRLLIKAQQEALGIASLGQHR